MLPIDLAAGGTIMLVLVLPQLLFYFGLCRKRWRRRESRKGDPCPFLPDIAAHNRCRVCGTYVSERAFHRMCSITTQHVTGNGTATVTTATTSGWNHCAGCQALKGHSLLALFLLGMFCLWAYTVIERTLAVLGVTHRDERIRTFSITLYALTVVIGLVGCAAVWFTRKHLLKFTCLSPCGSCCGENPSPSSRRSVVVLSAAVPSAVVPSAAVPVGHAARDVATPAAVVQGVRLSDNV